MGLLVFLLLLWFVLAVHRTLWWVWLWQLKENRLDRFFAEFSGRRLAEILFGWFERLKIVALLLGTLTAFILQGARWFGTVALGIYALEALFGGYQFWKGTARRPIFTLKTTFLILIVLGTQLASLAWILVSAGAVLPQATLVFSLFLLDLFLPFLAFVGVVILKIPTAVMRTLLISKATRWREGLPNLLVVGITGSFGKTSTKEFLTALLSKRFRVIKAPEHVNSEIALARFVLASVNATHEILVAELGAYKRGEIRRLTRMLKPQIGILTGINEQHLALFGSLESTKRAKYELIEALPAGGLAIFNADTAASHELFGRCPRAKKLFSASMPADCYAQDIRQESNDLVFQVKADGESRTFKVPLFGFHHIPNILAATAAALSLGMTLDEIRDRAQYLRAPGHTMHVGSDQAGRIVVDDTYSANPDGVFAALEALHLLGEVRRVLVMPSLIELGEASERIHEAIGKKIAEACDLAIITTPAGFAALERGVGSVEKTMLEPDPKKILAIIGRETRPGDVILLESRVPEAVRTVLLQSLNPNL